ncbi:MAG: hypothetical protein EA358_08370 [Flavobacteriales bacterium]|nr:MAG: hypothetical protein EA358_08370 [Flavobacteriales bacterium]
MKKLIPFIVLFLVMVSSSAYAQLTTSFYINESNSKYAIGYEFNEKLWADFRLFSGTSINNLTPEVVLNYNFLRRENYYTYAGGGIVVNNINGFVFPIGIGIKPLVNLKNLSLNIELSPLYETRFDDIFIMGFVGVRYVIDKKNN